LWKILPFIFRFLFSLTACFLSTFKLKDLGS
jgi:hypothetical protein